MSASTTNVVIGAASGMGAAVAARLAGRGPLLLADLRPDALGPPAPMIEATPLARQGSADKVAAVAAFLCSADASFVSGCDVLVDVGYVGATTALGA